MSFPVDERMNQYKVAQFMGVSPRTVMDWRYKNTGPKFYRIGTTARGQVYYLAKDVAKYKAKMMSVQSREHGGGFGQLTIEEAILLREFLDTFLSENTPPESSRPTNRVLP